MKNDQPCLGNGKGMGIGGEKVKALTEIPIKPHNENNNCKW